MGTWVVPTFWPLWIMLHEHFYTVCVDTFPLHLERPRRGIAGSRGNATFNPEERPSASPSGCSTARHQQCVWARDLPRSSPALVTSVFFVPAALVLWGGLDVHFPANRCSLGTDIFVFILFQEFVTFLGYVDYCFSPNLGSFQPLFLWIFFLLLSLSPLVLPWVVACNGVPHSPAALLILRSFFLSVLQVK